MYIYIYICIVWLLYVYIYIYIERERETYNIWTIIYIRGIGVHSHLINISRFAHGAPHIFATASLDHTCKVWVYVMLYHINTYMYTYLCIYLYIYIYIYIYITHTCKVWDLRTKLTRERPVSILRTRGPNVMAPTADAYMCVCRCVCVCVHVYIYIYIYTQLVS